jgi:PAS domain S-box-containing protein
MLATLLKKNEGLNKYRHSFQAGQTLFTEGDPSQDLYILIDGQLDILKGSKRIAEISGSGVFFGEMSFLLQDRRTSTVRARTDVVACRIPSEDIGSFLSDFPDVATVILRQIAQRLNETSQILYGFKEFCDRLPDAVVMTDREGAILSWNRAAEELYGGDWSSMRQQPAQKLFCDPEAYRQHIQDVQHHQSAREKVLEIKHPERGSCFVSASTTMLYDGHHNFQGVLSLCRDVTAAQALKSRYRFALFGLVPALLLAGLLLAVVFYGYPYFSKGQQAADLKKSELRSQLARDYLLLASLLAEPFAAGAFEKTHQVMRDFFRMQKDGQPPYAGLVLLDSEKKVLDAYGPAGGQAGQNTAGSSYAGIAFQGDTGSLHRVLMLYRAAPGQPMGSKGVEVAFELRRNAHDAGWLVFQMDAAALEKNYSVAEEDLLGFRFQKQLP